MNDGMDIEQYSMKWSVSHTPPTFHGGSPELKRSRFHSPMIQNAYMQASPALPTQRTPMQYGVQKCPTPPNQASKYGNIGSSQFHPTEINKPNQSTGQTDFSQCHSPQGTISSPSAEDKERNARLSNSTSSIFASSTLSNPDADQIILCLSAVLKIQMDHDSEAPSTLRESFSDFEVKGNGEWPDISAVPSELSYMYEGDSVDHIYAYVNRIYCMARFSPECCIISLVYLNRIISCANLPLHATNWRPLVLASLILAQKVWDDRSLATSTFVKIVPVYSKVQIYTFERRFLELLEYQAIVSQGLYARYYFELRDLFEHLMKQRDEDPTQIQSTFSLQPLSLWRAKQLELYSDSFRLQPLGNDLYQSDAGQAPRNSSMTSTPAQTFEDVTYTPRGRFVHS